MNKTIEKLNKLPHIELAEYEQEDKIYVIYFKPGFCWNGDFMGMNHMVIEHSAKDILRESRNFIPCNCEECKEELTK